MIRNLIGALVGSQIDRRDGRGGLKGAALGYVAQRAITRMGAPGLLLAGGYGLYRLAKDRRRKRDARV
ncbi:hypothetical protein Q9Q95_02150 [Sphingomonas sp. DG1-23]|uniref:hypothetical protein n=1 Tax=Sphingomonas sp. DG1-23 TaxID=3068316 RepID=UPI00273EE93F|nr:hypothetical protein [Sphingomonas sp. DG1-23]MDP5277713.1 hypothetical protein [Sphingomonas sp. DG1-23]